MLSVSTLVDSPFAVNYIACLCAVVTVGSAYATAVWLSRRLRPYLDDLEDNATVDRQHREVAEAAEREERGRFTAPSAPAEPSVAVFDAAGEVQMTAPMLHSSTELEFSSDGGKTWHRVKEPV